MFYNHFRTMFDSMPALRRAFARNIVLAWLLWLVAISTVGLKPQSAINGVVLLSTVGACFVNIFSAYLVSKFRYAYLYYLFVAIGGLSTLISPYLGAFELIGWENDLLLIFWLLFLSGTLMLLYLYLINLDEQAIKKYIASEKPKHTWNIEKDIYADLDKKHEAWLNITRIFIAPLAPVLGMALSRNLHGEQEWIIVGFMLLLLALILCVGYMRFFALGIKLLLWQRLHNSSIEVTNPQ